MWACLFHRVVGGLMWGVFEQMERELAMLRRQIDTVANCNTNGQLFVEVSIEKAEILENCP